MNPDQVSGHIEAMRTIIQRLREEAGLVVWINEPLFVNFWYSLNTADEYLADAIKEIKQ